MYSALVFSYIELLVVALISSKEEITRDKEQGGYSCGKQVDVSLLKEACGPYG